MSDFVNIELLPAGTTLRVPRGTALQDLLFAHGVEFPCGGRGRCKGCRIRIKSGILAVSQADQERLSSAEISDGWRLACQAKAESDLAIELAQWEATILSDDSVFPFTPQAGLGLAVDLGTTTIVAQLVNLRTGHVLGVRTALNRQAKHGADVMSRVEFAVAGGGHETLRQLARDQIGELVRELMSSAGDRREEGCDGADDLRSVVVVGNSVMHHVFCDRSLEPLSCFPFEPRHPELHTFAASDLGWDWASSASVTFLPCLGGFVGSDILAGILATNLHRSDPLVALIDLGTNGEIVVGNRERMLCASTAAGPAFEGARISMGMRAATGAISEVILRDGALHCHVLGQATARGICGSGLVDAVAVGLDSGRIQPSGRLTSAGSLALTGTVSLTQGDVRELQLAKGAIAAGLRILLEQWGASLSDLHCIYLAGAFGNYINRSSAHRIGLLKLPPEKVIPAGNTALLGAKIALFDLAKHNGAYPEVLAKVSHVSLNEDARFQEIFVEEMSFPDCSGSL